MKKKPRLPRFSLRTNLFRFLSYVVPRWPFLLGGTVAGVMMMFFPVTAFKTIEIATDTLIRQDGAGINQEDLSFFGYLPWLEVPAEWNVETQSWLLVKLLLTVFGIYVLVFAPCTFLRVYLTGKATHLSIFRLRFDLFRHIQRLSHGFFDTRQTGGIVSRMTSDIALAQNLIGQAGTNLWISLASLLFFAGILLSYNVSLALTTFAVLPLYIIILKIFKGRIKDTSRAVQQSMEDISGDLHERIRGISVVKSFAREKKEERKFFGDTHRLFDLTMHNIRLSGIFQTLTILTVHSGPLLVIYVGARQVLLGNLAVDELVFCFLMIGQFYAPLNQLTNLSVIFSNALAAIDRIFEVLDIEPDVAEAEEPYVPEAVRGEVVFRNVAFAYVEGKNVLENIDIHVMPGEVIALVGPSGSGKSTFSKLIPRFYDPTEGEVLIDDVDLREWKTRALRSNIGMVMQDTIVFSGTVRENLLYGNPNATNEEIVEAAKMANAHEFIQELPDGYHTIVGENGCQLSGGQRQRLSIARAFLTQPPILILDEATAALDPHSETLVQEALSRLMKGRTTFIIAHRLATVVHADRLMVLDHGRVVEMGSHRELMQTGGLYADLYNQQVSAMTGELIFG